jgi:hypothetical protein
MECCICKDVIDETTSCTRTTCGHTFHFGCLATWTTKAQSCPLCRHTFDEVSPPTRFIWEDLLARPSPYYRPLMISGRISIEESRRYLRQELTDLYAARPIEQYTGETPDPIDIEFMLEHTSLTRESALAYLNYYGDPVEVIARLSRSEDNYHIPDFRGTPSSEGYVSRSIRHRCTRGDMEDGYDSC